MNYYIITTIYGYKISTRIIGKRFKLITYITYQSIILKFQLINYI